MAKKKKTKKKTPTQRIEAAENLIREMFTRNGLQAGFYAYRLSNDDIDLDEFNEKIENIKMINSHIDDIWGKLNGEE